MPNYFVLALESALAVFGIRSVYEQPKYEVIQRVRDQVEIRRYAPRLAAETTVQAPDEEKGRNEAFRILASYIFGRNKGQTDIAMTSPVETGRAGREIAMTSPVESRIGPQEIPLTAPGETAANGLGRYSMRFFLPSSFGRAAVPEPDDARVKILELPPEIIAARTFSGSPNLATLAARKRELVNALDGTQWRITEQPFTLFYDPPFTIPFLRRNEVAVRVTDAADER